MPREPPGPRRSCPRPVCSGLPQRRRCRVSPLVGKGCVSLPCWLTGWRRCGKHPARSGKGAPPCGSPSLSQTGCPKGRDAMPLSRLGRHVGGLCLLALVIIGQYTPGPYSPSQLPQARNVRPQTARIPTASKSSFLGRHSATIASSVHHLPPHQCQSATPTPVVGTWRYSFTAHGLADWQTAHTLQCAGCHSVVLGTVTRLRSSTSAARLAAPNGRAISPGESSLAVIPQLSAIAWEQPQWCPSVGVNPRITQQPFSSWPGQQFCPSAE